EVAAGRRRFGVALGVLSLAVPVSLHVLTLALATGNLNAAWSLVHNASSRLNASVGEGQRITYGRMVAILVQRWKTLLRSVPFAATLSWLALQVVARDRSPLGARDRFLTAVLFAYGLPLNLIMLNGAYHHEFFVLMFAPLAALAAARISWHVMRASGRETTRA